jgi:branched-chain amino acid transport system ATP-binding protein
MTDAGLMSAVIGPSPAAFLVLTFVLAGATAWITGHALATTWKPLWQVVLYCLLLAAAARFLLFALFAGDLLSIAGYVVTALILLFFGLVSFRTNRARKMVSQYPWLYRREGLFGWADRNPGTGPPP